MADMIDRESLLNKLIFGNSDSIVLREYAIEFVKSAPTIDAVPVVRCKDCKWYGEAGCAIHIVDDSDKPKENDFCSFGERKDDGK